jgi:hypothetical protein
MSRAIKAVEPLVKVRVLNTDTGIDPDNPHSTFNIKDNVVAVVGEVYEVEPGWAAYHIHHGRVEIVK